MYTCNHTAKGGGRVDTQGLLGLPGHQSVHRFRETLFQGDKGEMDRACLNYFKNITNYLITVTVMKYPDLHLKGQRVHFDSQW